MRFSYVIVVVFIAVISCLTNLRAQPEQSEKPPFDACIDGPRALRLIDQVERKGSVDLADKKRFEEIWNHMAHQLFPTVPPTHSTVTFTWEEIAEVYIADCSYWIGVLSLAETDKGIMNLFQTNLDYMKWWLQNRREKQKQN